MNKKINFVKEEIKSSSNNFEIIVTASGTSLLPNRNVTAFSEYVAEVKEDRIIFYYIKSKGVFKKVYSIEDEVILEYSTIEHDEIGTNGSMMYLQLVVKGELNAIVCKRTDVFKLLIETINNVKNIEDVEAYNNFAK